MIQMSEQKEEEQLLSKAIEAFKANPNYATFAEGNPATEKLLALRWGIKGESVLLLRVDYSEPRVYCDVLPEWEWQHKNQLHEAAKRIKVMTHDEICNHICGAEGAEKCQETCSSASVSVSLLLREQCRRNREAVEGQAGGGSNDGSSGH
jgi:hypothetical protein